jgi:hypothetical protein
VPIPTPTTAPIYQYVHEINGNCHTITQLLYDNTPVPSFGSLAGWYLLAHGYTPHALLHISHALDMSTTAADFINTLTGKDMAMMDETTNYSLRALVVK